MSASPPAPKDFSTILGFATCATLHAKAVLVPPITNVLPVMKQNLFTL